MSSGYPSTEDEAGGFRSPDSFDQSREKKRMTAVEIGIIVGTVMGFGLVLFLVFYCRHLEQRRKRAMSTGRATEEMGKDGQSTKLNVLSVEDQDMGVLGGNAWVAKVKQHWFAIRGGT